MKTLKFHVQNFSMIMQLHNLIIQENHQALGGKFYHMISSSFNITIKGIISDNLVAGSFHSAQLCASWNKSMGSMLVTSSLTLQRGDKFVGYLCIQCFVSPCNKIPDTDQGVLT